MRFKTKTKMLEDLSIIFARLYYKINNDIKNTSSFILPTDLLRDNIKCHLFKIVTVHVEDTFCSLIEQGKELTPKQSKALFFSLLHKILKDFLQGYYGLKFTLSPSIIREALYTKSILIDEALLLNVPLQILQTEDSTLFRSIFLPVYAKAYDNFVEALLDNLVVELSNAVIYIILSDFSFIYSIRKDFYRSNFFSLRNVERFRNNLNWQNWLKLFVRRPANLYNSQQGIWIIRTTGIYYRVIYANRPQELQNLDKFALVTLFTIEIKDFLVSRLDETFYFLGNNVRYFFTSVVGQIIGLVWRGIIEGLKK